MVAANMAERRILGSDVWKGLGCMNIDRQIPFYHGIFH